MNSKIIYWTLNTHSNEGEGIFLDGDGRSHNIWDGEQAIGREESARMLAKMCPRHKYIWLEDPEEFYRIMVDMRNGERNLDARPLAQVAATIQKVVPSWHPLNQQARMVADLAEQYEQGQINQSCLLHRLEESGKDDQPQHFARFLRDLANIHMK